jgi:PTH1 family peptidyl-tRNA hydrolase
LPIKLVVGLGNPGKSYASTRHNVGRRVVEYLEKKKPEGVYLLIPEVFMNTSGVPVAQLVRKKGFLPENVLIVSDDFELPLGSLRIRLKGSSGGHNGLQSVLENLGTQNVPRLRLGIGPVPEGEDPADFVLKPFASGEKKRVDEAIQQAAEAVSVATTEGIETAMNRFNKRAESNP